MNHTQAMKRRIVRSVASLCLVVSLLSLSTPGTARPRDVEVGPIETTRFEGKAGFFGTVKVTKAKTVKGLVMSIEFFDAQGTLLTIQKQTIEEDHLAAGDEVDFDLEGKDVPRAVSFRVVMYDLGNMELTVAGGGPHPF